MQHRKSCFHANNIRPDVSLKKTYPCLVCSLTPLSSSIGSNLTNPLEVFEHVEYIL